MFRSLAAKSTRRFAQRRCLSFNFAGPRSLNDILKKELVADKTANEVADLWLGFHEAKVRMVNEWSSKNNGDVVAVRIGGKIQLFD